MPLAGRDEAKRRDIANPRAAILEGGSRGHGSLSFRRHTTSSVPQALKQSM